MKIATLTFFRQNYGAILQAYALQVVLESLGHSPEIIDYEEVHHRNESLFGSWKNVKELIYNLFTVLRYRLFLERRQLFLEFREKNMHVSLNKYFISSELEKDQSKYDAFICGSDQVWYPRSNADRNRMYYLGFIKQDQAVKISYAPSFGASSVPQRYHQEIETWIKDIPNLSVREETGRKIVEQVAGRQATVVLDPTLLLERTHWDNIAKPPSFKAPYILVYSTSQRGLFPELVKHIKRTTHLPVVVLSLYSLNLIPKADHVIYNAGPKEFVGLFAHAACVCTNSFHGTAFSIIYRKPFWSVPHNATNSRMADLLSRVELSSRQVSSPELFPVDPLKIDYTGPALLLNQHREKSIDFLKSALK
jgi:hypothetical protein